MVSKGIRYAEEYKRDAVSQVTDRGYSVKEVSGWWGVITQSMCGWNKRERTID
jgi:transposase